MQKAHINGIDLAYNVHGDGEPVAFLNGILMSMGSWSQQTNLMQRYYQCIMHDFRGQLFSDKPEQEYSLELHAEDFRLLLDHLGIDRCHLVGTSYGGEIAMVFAYTHPERVKSLSVISSVSQVGKLLEIQAEAWSRAALTGDVDLLMAVLHSMVYGEDYLATNEAAILEYERLFRKLPKEFFQGLARLIRSFLKINITHKIKGIACPTLVVCGEQDLLKPPSYSRILAENIPGAEYAHIPDAGHVVVYEKSNVINSLLLGFIQKQLDSN